VPAPEVPSVGSLMSAAPGAGGAPGARALSATGTLYARAEASLGPNASGTLSHIAVREGDKVKKGQLLFRLESAQANLAVQQARASLESARVNLRAVELEFNRTKELYDRGSVPQASFEQVQARYDLAKSSLAQSEVQLALLQKTAADAVVRSPIDGVVTSKLKNVGEAVSMVPPTIVLVVQDVNHLELRARLPEHALGSIKPGSKLLAVFPALGVRREVLVSRINPAVDVATRTVEVIADVDNADGSLRPGMLADVTLGSDAFATGGAGRGGAP
jgi:RND family efflux transporter MFP subunit